MEDTNFTKMAIKLQAIRKISDYKYDALNKKLLGISDSVELDTESDIKGKVNLKQASKYTGLCYGTFYYRFREDKLRHICLVKKPILIWRISQSIFYLTKPEIGLNYHIQMKS